MGKSGKKLHYEGSTFHRVSLMQHQTAWLCPCTQRRQSCELQAWACLRALQTPLCLSCWVGGNCTCVTLC